MLRYSLSRNVCKYFTDWERGVGFIYVYSWYAQNIASLNIILLYMHIVR